MHGEYKVPGGKLVVVDFEVVGDVIRNPRVAGDFFLEPDEALGDINAALDGLAAASDAKQIAAAITAGLRPDAVMLGFSPEAIAVAMRRAMTDATSWADYEWEIVHDPAVPPRLHLALDEVLATRVGEGRRKPTLRFWEWDESAVVIGSFQSVKNEVDPEGAEKYGFDVVRRISGGGAMMMEKGNVVTYSLYVPAELVQGMSFADSYAFLDDWVLQGLRAHRHRGDLPAAQRHREPRRQDRRRRAEAARRGRRAAPRHHGVRPRQREDARGAAHRAREDQRQGHRVGGEARRPAALADGAASRRDHRAPEADVHVALRSDARHGDSRRDGRGRRARRVEVRDERLAPPRALTGPSASGVNGTSSDPLYNRRVDWWMWLLIAALVLAFGWVAVRRGWIDLSDKTKRGGGGGGVMMIGDEVFAPRKHEAQVELDRQSRLPVPAPVPGDGDKGIAFADEDEPTDVPARADRFKGSIRLDVER